MMGGLDAGSRPSSLGILRKYYFNVVQLNEHIKKNVSENRFAKVLRVAGENEGMKRLIETAYVCVNPKLFADDDDDGLDDPSIVSTGESMSQSEVQYRSIVLIVGCQSRFERVARAFRKPKQRPLSGI